MKIKLEVELDTEREQDQELLMKLIEALEEYRNEDEE